MPRAKKTEDVQPKAVQEPQPQAEGVSVAAEQRSEENPRRGIQTTAGNLINNVQVKLTQQGPVVEADYHRVVTKDGKVTVEKGKAMPAIPMTPAQLQEFRRLTNEGNKDAAKDFVVKEVYPMFVNDKAFNMKPATILGKPVDYLNIMPITKESVIKDYAFKAGLSVEDATRAVDAMTEKERNKLLRDVTDKKWQIQFGVKGDSASRVFGKLTDAEKNAYRYRADIVFDKDGKLVSLKPVTAADVAERAGSRLLAVRAEKVALQDAASKIDWGQYKYPEAGKVTGERYADSKEPGRAWLNGMADGVQVYGLLTKEETMALKTKTATFEQVFMHNPELRGKLDSLLNPKEEQQVSYGQQQQRSLGMGR